MASRVLLLVVLGLGCCAWADYQYLDREGEWHTVSTLSRVPEIYRGHVRPAVTGDIKKMDQALTLDPLREALLKRDPPAEP